MPQDTRLVIAGLAVAGIGLSVIIKFALVLNWPWVFTLLATAAYLFLIWCIVVGKK